MSPTEAQNATSVDKAVFEHVVQAAVSIVMAEGENLDKVRFFPSAHLECSTDRGDAHSRS